MNALMSDFHAICDFGGRFAGSDGEAAACEWLEARLGQVTGEAPRRVPVNYRGWSRGEAVLERLDGPGGTYECISLVRSPPTSADGLEADLIDVGRGTEADFDAAGMAVDGNVVLVRHEYMFAAGTVHRRRKYGWAVDRGAAGFLIAGHLPGSDLPVTGSSGATPEWGIPAAGISAATAQALTRSGPARVRLRIDADEAPRSGHNLILDLPGRGPEWVVLSAHIDGHHLAESAMDNGTGLAAALAVVAGAGAAGHGVRMRTPGGPVHRRGMGADRLRRLRGWTERRGPCGAPAQPEPRFRGRQPEPDRPDQRLPGAGGLAARARGRASRRAGVLTGR